MDQAWLTATVVALSALHVLVLLSALRARRAAASEEVEREADGAGVRCPDCDEVNEPGDRVCRRCVTRLPGRAADGDGMASPASRRTTWLRGRPTTGAGGSRGSQ